MIKIYPFALRILFAACAALWSGLANAQPHDSHWQAAMQASSERFRLFALMAQRPDGAGDAVAALQLGQGFAHLPNQGPQRVASGISLGPVLRYDNNINGGTPGETILIAGFPFTISAESRAKQGLVLGVSAGGNLRLSLSPTTILDANLSASKAKGQGSLVQSAAASVCLGQFLGGTNWLDLCIQRDKSERALSQNDQTTASIGLTQQFATDFALFEAQAKLRQAMTGDYDKLFLDLGLATARAQWGLLETRAEFGQYILGEHTRLFGASLLLSRPILGVNTTLFASYSREGGANFFGAPRRDEVVSLGLSRPINDVLGLNLSLQDRASTLANYDGVTFGVDFTFRNFTF